jgi:hypothetical protein
MEADVTACGTVSVATVEWRRCEPDQHKWVRLKGSKQIWKRIGSHWQLTVNRTRERIYNAMWLSDVIYINHLQRRRTYFQFYPTRYQSIIIIIIIILEWLNLSQECHLVHFAPNANQFFSKSVNAVRFSNRTLRITLDKNARNARFLFCLLTNNCTLKLAIVTATKKNPQSRWQHPDDCVAQETKGNYLDCCCFFF